MSMGSIYFLSGDPVRVVVNGQVQRIRARHQLVEEILFQAGVSLNVQDIVTPERHRELQPDQPIEITLARPVVVSFGETGHRHPEQVFTTKQTPVEIYKDFRYCATTGGYCYCGWGNLAATMIHCQLRCPRVNRAQLGCKCTLIPCARNPFI